MKILIVGGVAGGATVAARLRRLDEQAEVILFERGKYVSYANCGLPYYIGGTIADRSKLFVQTAKGFTDRFRIDIRTEPILVYPTLHYQNGGLHITPDGQTDVENLFAAGEVVGGIHGRNRLMGNSLLDVIVFGRNAGQHAAEKAKSVTVGALTLSHVAAFEAEKQQAGVSDHRPSPQLLPDYARKIHPVK